MTIKKFFGFLACKIGWHPRFLMKPMVSLTKIAELNSPLHAGEDCIYFEWFLFCESCCKKNTPKYKTKSERVSWDHYNDKYMSTSVHIAPGSKYYEWKPKNA